jgi:hypothetical protein
VLRRTLLTYPQLYHDCQVLKSYPLISASSSIRRN